MVASRSSRWLASVVGVAGLLAIGLWCMWRSSRHAESPEEAIAMFLGASRAHDRSALDKVWWISADSSLQHRVIETEIASAIASDHFNERLRRVYGDELRRLANAGKLRLPEERDPPTAAEIAQAVATALREEGRLVVFVPGCSLMHVAQHDEHWYVEHDFVAVGRDFKDKDLQVHRAMAELYRRLDAQIGKPGLTAWDLLKEQQNGFSMIAAEYGAPILLR